MAFPIISIVSDLQFDTSLLYTAQFARAYLFLARLAAARGERQLAIEHLQTYLKLVPDAPDAGAVRQLIEGLCAKE